MCSVASLDLDVCILGREGGPLALVTCLNSTAVGGLIVGAPFDTLKPSLTNLQFVGSKFGS